jgi:pimeloyl-ACP methyl ester carboxylesterase
MLATITAASVVLMHSCMTFRTTDAKIKREFRENNLEAHIERFQVPGFNHPLRVIGAPVDNNKKIAVFFVHGAPGSSQDFFKFLQDSSLLSKANLYSIDRPGYGHSNFGHAEVSVQRQAQIIAAVIEQLPEQKVIVLGHSFGGPIAPLTAVYTPKIIAAIMLAPAIDPQHEKILKIAYLGKWKATRWLAPKALRVAADEKFSHVEALREVQPLWSQLKMPVWHYHGTEDMLVPYENLAFAFQHFDTSRFTGISIEGENHFLPWSQYAMVQTQLLKLLEVY